MCVCVVLIYIWLNKVKRFYDVESIKTLVGKELNVSNAKANMQPCCNNDY